MSYICEFCGSRPECCACSIDLTEPRLETELAVADNMMAVENPKPYGLLNAPSASAFFSLLTELEEEEDQIDLGPVPQLTRNNNNIPEQDEPLICDTNWPTTPIKSIKQSPPIPKLERQSNMPPEIKIEDNDLQDLAVELFPEEEAVLEYLKQPQSPEYLDLSNKLYNSGSYEDFCSTLVEMKDLYDVETSVEKKDEPKEELPYIDYCETCCDFSCHCDKLIPCECGTLYHIDEPYGMCFSCEMAQRRQDSIDQELYPDDIRERYDSY